MAERRMFAKTIIDSDAFLEMPLSTQALYFHLSMRADDDGFINNPKKIARLVNATDDDLKLLAAKNFIIPFSSGIVVIKHWRIHNYIQNDRYKPTVYTEEAKCLNVKENKAYTLVSKMDTECIQTVSKMETQDRIELGKDSLEKGKDKIEYLKILSLFNETCVSLASVKKLTDARKRSIKNILNKNSMEDLETVFHKTEASDFLTGHKGSWQATFDWLMNEKNFVKVLEGNYDNRPEIIKNTGKVNWDAV